ncbi:hypothetical protein Pryu01_00280 [Paraliobacillus ryukyuensis]|uniref:Uncharacterized protein n=1 Tax=Paraliobacillus ryukyuensis TaxID=200904 RepID=A0A366EH30_9BACI|nr:hypothetical protein [Paraliobacillus ryukyuensis]RBP01648.1 hypothetical protein DES48_101389 [Paraliobacillus ryukyuensis]
MVKVRMLVQTRYNEQLLRVNKEYDIPKETAIRWDQSKLAEIVENPKQQDKN